MLQPADVLLLDEPTNDLDIPTLEILEESLLEYRGALALVTHDRYMLDRVSTIVLGLDGRGAAEHFADYSQWEEWLRSQQTKSAAATVTRSARASRVQADAQADQSKLGDVKKQRSQAEIREAASIEKRIAKAEEDLQAKRAVLESPEIASDAVRLHEAYAQMEAAQKVVDELYARWAELESKGASGTAKVQAGS
jgi:ATP-binding cassette subfamily F protein uup